MILAVLFIAASIAVGYAVVRAIRFCESREEEFVAAAALGLPLTALAAFAAFFFAGGNAALFAAIALGVCAAALLYFNRAKTPALPKAQGFWIRILPFVVVLALFFANGAMHFNERGDLTLTSDFFADAYYHVSFERYFAYGGGPGSGPLQDPQYAGAPPGYSFLTDFYSGMLERGGFNFPQAFVLPALFMICVFYAAFYFFVLRLSKNKNAAFFAVALLFFSGSFAYATMYEDASKQGITEWIEHPANDYSALEENGKLGNLTQFTKAYLLPQRSNNFGYPVALIVFMLLFEAVREKKDGRKSKKKEIERNKDKRKLLLAAGVLTGTLPLMRETAFFACLCVAAFTALAFIDLKNLRRWFIDWMFFAVPALVIAAPALPLVTTGAAAGADYVTIAIGWKAHALNPLKIAWFWFRTLGLPLAFAAAGFFFVRKEVKLYYLAFVPLFIAANVFQFSPDPLNNMKIINFWEIPTFALAGIALAKLAGSGGENKKSDAIKYASIAAAILLFVVAIAPGASSLWRQHDDKVGFYSASDFAFAEWANAALPQNAVLISLGGPHALDLVGRPRVLGFPAVGWVKGRSYWYDRVLALQAFYAGQGVCETAVKYGATHAVVTPSERNQEKFNATAFQNNPALHKIYDNEIKGQLYEVYEIRC